MSAHRFSRVVLTAILLTIPVLFHGQGYIDTVSGEITDPTLAVVPGAQVKLVDQQKGYQFTTTSDKSGRYLFTSIPPGIYSVPAEMQGFEKGSEIVIYSPDREIGWTRHWPFRILLISSMPMSTRHFRTTLTRAPAESEFNATLILLHNASFKY
jgi:hypothetical protein